MNFDVLHKPHVQLRVDDGRNYLLLTRKRYDVIAADIIQPIQAGAGNIYSVEYFRLARNALADDGVILQWIGTRDAAQYKLIMRTFLSVFPETTLWADGTLMVGSKRRFHFEAEQLQRKLQDPRVQAVYAMFGTPTIDVLAHLYTAGPEELRRFVGDGAVLTDDRPSIEYFLSITVNPRSI